MGNNQVEEQNTLDAIIRWNDGPDLWFQAINENKDFAYGLRQSCQCFQELQISTAVEDITT